MRVFIYHNSRTTNPINNKFISNVDTRECVLYSQPQFYRQLFVNKQLASSKIYSFTRGSSWFRFLFVFVIVVFWVTLVAYLNQFFHCRICAHYSGWKERDRASERSKNRLWHVANKSMKMSFCVRNDQQCCEVTFKDDFSFFTLTQTASSGLYFVVAFVLFRIL